MSWLSRHSQALQALGALLTAAFALVALVGVKFQLDASERIAREGQARDIYRSFVALSLDNPQFADPGACAEFEGQDATSYDYYMEYALYTAEQVIAMDPCWDATFEALFADHLPWICEAGTEGYTDAVGALVTGLQARECAAISAACN